MEAAHIVNPFRCRMWLLHDRLDSDVTEESCRAEIDSFSKHGQFVPVLGRILHDDPDYDIELIYGARRLFVARHLNIPIAVDVRELSDREAIIAMDIENRQRTDISPYERGLSYARWIRGGHLKSQDDIARTLKVSASQVSRLLKLAKLPSVVIGAFRTPVDICETWGLDLSDALDDPDRRQATLQKARALSCLSERPPAREVYRCLIAAAVRGRKLKTKVRDEVVKGQDGTALFRIRHQTSCIALLLPAHVMSVELLGSIRNSIVQILQSGSGQEIDPEVQSSEVKGSRTHATASLQQRDYEAEATQLF
jgi:ParB family chromosome partitioning protein